jgi:hypothetical protein
MVKRFLINFGVFWVIFAAFKGYDILLNGALAASTSFWFLQIFVLAIIVTIGVVILENFLRD